MKTTSLSLCSGTIRPSNPLFNAHRQVELHHREPNNGQHLFMEDAEKDEEKALLARPPELNLHGQPTTDESGCSAVLLLGNRTNKLLFLLETTIEEVLVLLSEELDDCDDDLPCLDLFAAEDERCE